MNNNRFKLISVCLLSLGFFGLSSGERGPLLNRTELPYEDFFRDGQSVPSNNEVNSPRKQTEYLSEIVIFDKETADISKEQLENLKDITEKAKSSGKVYEIEIAAWSDIEFPAPNGQKIMPADQKLAVKRGLAVKRALENDFQSIYIKIVNMAKGSDWFEKLVNTNENQLKTLLKKFNDSQFENLSDDMKIIYNNAESSAAIVVFKIDTGADENSINYSKDSWRHRYNRGMMY